MDQNSLFNKDTRVFAFDDSPFSRSDEYSYIVGVIMRKDLYTESIVKKKIRVDGLDSTEKVTEAIREKGAGVRVIMTQGITLGGFNILDVRKLYGESGIPIINVVDHEPDMGAIKEALKKYFDDWEFRCSLLSEDFHRFERLYIQGIGIEPEVANKFVRKMIVNGNIPEPLRIADLIAGVV